MFDPNIKEEFICPHRNLTGDFRTLDLRTLGTWELGNIQPWEHRPWEHRTLGTCSPRNVDCKLLFTFVDVLLIKIPQRMSLFRWIHFPPPLLPHLTDYISQNALYHTQKMCPHRLSSLSCGLFCVSGEKKEEIFQSGKSEQYPLPQIPQSVEKCISLPLLR